MAQTEPARGEPLLIRCTHGAAVLYIGRVHVGRQGRYERMEHVGRESDERRELGIGVGKGDLESEDGRGIRA